jgi:signal transduction histidine kinase/ActR/RegA family two-component response regulator
MSAKEQGGLADLIRRLEQRLEQEKRARVEAEALGELGMRELYERQQILGLLEAIATASNGDQPLEDTLRFALSRICEFMGWAVGHVYWVAPDQDRLYSSGIWHGMEAEAREDFRRATAEVQLWRGRGLPGRVLASGDPLWVRDVAVDADFPRQPSAERCGLHAAFAFPVLIGAKTVAIYEFFSLEVAQPDPAVLRAMAQIGSVLGRAIERKRAEETLHEQVAEAMAARQAAEAASRAKSDFLAVTSHEVRTPLNAVLGLAQALRTEPLTERQSMLVDGVLDAGAMLLRLLNAVLDLTRIESGKMSLDLAAFDLVDCAETVVRIWRPRAAERAVTLRLEATRLPGGAGLMSDRGKIEQVLVNLVANALKFTPVGGCVDVRVSETSEEDGRVLVRLDVADQGPGVAPADRERIFQPFEQTAAGREAGGAGLGLSICAGHAALLGGRMGVDGAPGGGARFWMEFCADPAPAEDIGAAAPAPAPPPLPEPYSLGPQGASAPAGALRVLAAEHHAVNRMVLQALLEPTGAAVTFAENGREALAALEGASFDLVLMDVNMPVMDGVAALTAIRALPGPAARTPVHMVTANVFEEDVQRYLDAGADGVLKKPIDMRELLALIGQTAALRGSRPEEAQEAAGHRQA